MGASEASGGDRGLDVYPMASHFLPLCLSDHCPMGKLSSRHSSAGQRTVYQKLCVL